MNKVRSTINSMKMRAEKFVPRHDLFFKSIFTLFFVILVALQPALMQGSISDGIPNPYHDFGVFESKDALISNVSAISQSSEIAQIAEDALNVKVHDITGDVQYWDGISNAMTFENQSIPQMNMPGILEKARDFGVDDIISTILDGRSYYIYANSTNNPNGTWITQWSVGDPLKRPVIHSKLVSDNITLELLNPTPVDIDSDGVDDIEVELIIEATVKGGLSTLLNDPLSIIPIPSLPIVPELGDRPPNVRITNPPTNFWVIGRTFDWDYWQLAGWTWEFDLEFDAPEIERVVVSIDNNSENADWQKATLTSVLSPLPSWPMRRWYRWFYNWSLEDVENGLHTVYVRAYEGDEFTEDSVKVYVSNPVYQGLRLLVKIDRINPAFNQTSEINILRPVSHGDSKSVWSLGMNFDNITDNFTAYLSPESLSLNNHLPTPGSSLLGSIAVEYLEGPFRLGWNASETPEGLGFCFSHAQVDSSEQNLTDVTWLRLNFTGSEPPRYAELKLGLNTTIEPGLNISADANLLKWQSDRITNLTLEYHDERDGSTIHVQAGISGMPRNLEINLQNQTRQKPYDVYTSMHFNSSTGIHCLVIDEFIFEKGILELGLGITIQKLPKSFFLNGTYSALSVQAPDISNLAGSFMWPYMWDVISMYVGRIFVQVAERVVSLPMRLMGSGLLSGEYILRMPGDEKMEELSFHLTDNIYPQSNGNYLCFFEKPGSNLSLSSRFLNIRGLHARSNESGILLDAQLETDEDLRIINVHGNGGGDFEYVHLANIPGHLTLSLNDTLLNYSADENVDEFEFLSNNSGTHIYVKITDLPRKMSFVTSESSMMLDTCFEKISTIEFTVSDSSALSIDGNYLMLVSESDSKMLSGRISNLKKLYYSNALPQTLAISLDGGEPLSIMGRIESDKKLELDAKIVNIPDELTVSVPNDRFSTSFDILDIASISGVKDLVGKFAALAEIGEVILGLMVNLTELLATELMELTQGASISYSFAQEYNMDLIAQIKHGDVSLISDCIWTHGISAKSDSEGSLHTKVFLSGIPQSAEIKLELSGERRTVDLKLGNFRPRYDFLIFDVKVMDEIQVLLYADYLPGRIELLSLYSSFNITAANTMANLDFNVISEEDLKGILLEGKILEPYPTKVEMYLSSVPKILDTSILAQNDIILKHNASAIIQYLLVNISREIDEKYHNGTIIAHEIPTYLNFAFKTNTNYERNTPLLGMPIIDVNTNSAILDIYMNIQGRIFGRRGSYEIFFENIRSGLTAALNKETYRIRAEKLDNFVMVTRNMPIMSMYHLNKIELFVRDLRSLDLKVSMAAGALPVIQMDNTDCKDLKLSLSHDMEILGAKLSPEVVLSEATFYKSENPDLLILFKSPTHINGMATTLRSGNTVVIVPNLFMTLVVTFAPIFIVLHVVLFALWGVVKIHGGMKKKRKESQEQKEESRDAKNEGRPQNSYKKSYEKEKGRWGRKKKLAVVVILLIILGGLLYYFAFPWVELSVKTKFNETPSGIFVACEASNTGTVVIEDLEVSFSVYNASGVLMNSTSYSASLLKRWQYEESYVHYHGDQVEPYRIAISVYFKANGKGYRDTFSHEARDYMRLEFEKKVP